MPCTTILTPDRATFEASMNALSGSGARVQSTGRDAQGNWWGIYQSVTTSLTFTYKTVLYGSADHVLFEAAVNTLDAAYWRMVSAGRDNAGNWWAVMILYPTGPYS